MLIPLELTSLGVLMADGIAKMSLVLYNHQLLICIIWQMLLPSGRWNGHCRLKCWQMLLPCGRWNSHCRVGVLADVSAMWQME